jgi:hypothetical protein
VPLSASLDQLRSAAAAIATVTGARAEQSLYGDFQTFLNASSEELRVAIRAVPQITTGRLVPDFGLYRETNHVGWVELKAPDKDLDSLRGHDQTQFERMREDLEAFVITNGLVWRLYVNGQLVAQATLQREALRDPSVELPDAAVADLEALLEAAYSRAPSVIANPDEATVLMAHRARALRRAVAEQMRGTPEPLLEGLYDEFNELVYKSGRAYSHTDFADAYAQTAVFGLLLARLETGAELALDTAATGIDAAQHPFLHRCLSIMTDAALAPDLRTLLQEAVTTVNRIPPRIFQRNGDRDPLLYAYENFFAAYDPTERASRGVYYTPPYVVSYQVEGVHALLRNSFGFSGLTDAGVRYLDPATGSGTYLLGLLERALELEEAGGGAADAAIAEMVQDRVRAFELMIGPYTVAHQRVSTFLRDERVMIGSRLPIYLVDTLAEALEGVEQSRFGPIGAVITQEREAAERVKTTEPILVVIGNPPYDRIRRAQIGDHWLLERIQDLIERTPAADRGQIHPIYDFYVAFWRWALWLVAERGLDGVRGRGIVAYITNRSWIIGKTFGGMRSVFTERCRAVYVLDLGGDLRTSGTRLHDQNVFDVGVGVAITFAVVDVDHAEPAEVYYQRIFGTRTEKEQHLRQSFDLQAFAPVERLELTDPFLPVDWDSLATSASVEDLFLEPETGVQTSRDSLVVGVRPDDLLTEAPAPLEGTIGTWSRLEGAERDEVFHTTTTHPVAPGGTPSRSYVTRYAYRPLDYRHLYNDPRFIHRPRPALQRAFRRPEGNLALVTIERGFGPGPAAFPVDELPDLHVFRGFGGARGVYPLYGRAQVGRRAVGAQLTIAPEEHDLEVMLSAELLEWAANMLASPDPETVFAYLCAVLGAPAYVPLFEERGLIAGRPRVPLTLDPELAAEGARLGSMVIDFWTLRAEPHAAVRWAVGTTAAVMGDAARDEQEEALAVAGRRLEGITTAVWEFEVSGYPVLLRYCQARADQPTSGSSLDELRRVASAIRSLVELGPELDLLLERILAGDLASWGSRGPTD